MQFINIQPLKESPKIKPQGSSAHHLLGQYNRTRINPALPQLDWRQQLHLKSKMELFEGELIEREREEIMEWAAQAPTAPEDLLRWFEELIHIGPGQNDPLFPWLAQHATKSQMTWFIQQEVAGEAGFEDLTALTQIKFSSRPKLEMARNYWDEMGRGQERGMHGPMLAKVAEELGLGDYDLHQIEAEPLALANTLLGLALHRRYAYHAVGALGAIELTAPARAHLVYQGLKRLGLSGEGQRYYLLHSTLDVKHSLAWNQEVILPLVQENPKCARALAEGALMRLNLGAKCFKKYRAHFGLK